MSETNGGAAFPGGESYYKTVAGNRTDYKKAPLNKGMSLRDWFAGQALAGLVPNAAWDYSSGPCNASAAERCYAIADAMLAEREKEADDA